MACGPLVIFGCGGGVVQSVTTGLFDGFTKYFSNAASGLLKAFADQFVSIPGLDFSGTGLSKVYGMSMGIAAVVAALLMMLQVARALWSRSGEPLAQAFAGLGKASLAFVLTLSVGATAQDASSELAAWIVNLSFHDPTTGKSDGQVFSEKLTRGLLLSDPAETLNLGGLLLLVSLITIIVVIILWVEMIMANAALAVLVATSPIPASGQMSKLSEGWWPKTVRGAIQLMLLKPTIAMIFAIGFAVGGERSSGVTQAITGVCILAIAVIAWPALARFMSWTSSQASSSGGFGALLGFAAGRASSAAGGGPIGTPPGLGAGGSGAGAVARASAGAATGGVATALQATAAVARATKAAADAAVGHMDQMAGHAGMGTPTVRIGGGAHYPAHRRANGGAAAAGDNSPPTPPPAAAAGPASSGHVGAYPDADLADTQELPRIDPGDPPPVPANAQTFPAEADDYYRDPTDPPGGGAA